ncbi:FecR family protein [Sphingobacterium yanglingense]|uniref:FecR family protein n=1 Tax=Sphingobacterium yanglingense TaxID=1437280 RepID=A0A4R6WKR1_9SPHI|nr:FecR domain-containing protein [Sphingobacterium yanglingense]TDQ79302.1 FecR family protein [Sphingobacterium yanglingense]
MESQEFDKSYYITGLIRRKIQQQPLSPQEEEELHKWRHECAENGSFYERIRNERELAQSVNRYLATDTAQRWTEFHAQHIQRKDKIRPMWQAWSAAVLLLAISISVLFYFYKRDASNFSIGRDTLVNHDRMPSPGGNRAMLVWEDGSSIELSGKHSGLIVGKELAYEDGSQLSEAKTIYATLKTPKGGQYRVELPDGTKVWLNAASSLRYPTRFDGDQRKVMLSGEAYFEVAHNPKQPFIVETARQHLSVLGTVFNINAYEEEEQTTTTLLEGKVALQSRAKMEKSVFLDPGKQSILLADEFKVTAVDKQEAVAWKEGKFVFNGSDIYAVMRQIERWYDVEVVYEGDMASVLFTGSLSRFADIGTVAEKLELTREIKLTIQGRRITVRKR